MSRIIASYTRVREVIIHTGQHYDANMSDVFFREMQIPKPDYSLSVGGGSHGAMVGQMIQKIEAILLVERPDFVMVYGDTNSTLAGAIAASKLNIKIAHIEAGLRSFNMNMPEEVNRILTDRVSSLLFCPTQAAVDNLNREGITTWMTGAELFLVGDVMQDSAMFYKGLAIRPPNLPELDNFVLCTIHRAENTDDVARFGEIIAALNEIALAAQVIIPVHPRTRKIIEMGDFDTTNLTLIDPVGYLAMVWLLDNCNLVMTDSGGLQKEAFFFNKPCITLRNETEWVELVNRNVNVLVGAHRQGIMDAYQSHVFSQDYNAELYGAGKASTRIVDVLLDFEL